MQIENELNRYLDEKGCRLLFIRIIENMLMEAPDNPVQFIVEFLKANYPSHCMHLFDRVPLDPDSRIRTLFDPKEIGMEDGLVESDDEEKSSKEYTISNRFNPKKRRMAVSAETLKLHEENERTIKPPKKERSESLIGRMTEALQQNCLFEDLTEAEILSIVNALTPVRKLCGDIIFKQDGPLSGMVFISKGHCTMTQKRKKKTEDGTEVTVNERIGKMPENSIVVDSALMAPQKATFTMKVGSPKLKAWKLARWKWHLLRHQFAIERYNVRLEAVRCVPIFGPLTDHEKDCLTDALYPLVFDKDEMLVRQGDKVDRLGIIQKGEVVCEQTLERLDGKVAEVCRLGEGQCFGQTSLITEQVQNVSIRADTKVTGFWVDRDAAVRVLGPIREILKRDDKLFASFMSVLL
eukprot:TRINITY_DN35688_c0_g1_i1.p1 TRINITY_DN35688_c0_g1~~TRINITY_DN35688_c0_g1_i1.p1  ORF type:complete len:408 (+),score=101.26 TRINITY_DN35688_c0_g1_i1:70-1293(+)